MRIIEKIGLKSVFIKVNEKENQLEFYVSKNFYEELPVKMKDLELIFAINLDLIKKKPIMPDVPIKYIVKIIEEMNEK